MSTPTFTREDLEVLAGGQTLAGGRIADVCDLARYALALVRNINEWMIYKQRRIDDLEAELAAEQGETEEVDRQWKKAIEQYAALEAERDDLKEAVAQEKYFRDEDVERLEAGRDAANDRANHYQRQRDELHAENEKLRAALRAAAEIIHDECHPVRHMETCVYLAAALGEKDGGK
jgi:chromosome segregation ATPase